MSSRPRRAALRDEHGAIRTLSEGPGAFEPLFRAPSPDHADADAPALLLGLGPRPADAAALARGDVLWCECSDFAGQMDAAWRERIPASWREIRPEDVAPGLLRGRQVLLYRQGPRLFPTFWGPVLGRVRALALAGAPAPAAQEAWLASDPGGLLTRELARAFRDIGLGAREIPADETRALLPGLLRESRPALFVSVNFKGLDPEGEIFHLLAALDVPVAVWLVDNPFHLLGGLKSTFWREARLFVSDESFVPLLKEHGAAHVHHLPLAAPPEVFAHAAPDSALGLAERLLFVGRSEFPDRKGFFAGLRTPPELAEEALRLLERGERPDFHWWRGRLGLERLWPGNAARAAGLGAEETGRAWRAACLREAEAGAPLTVVGDAAWAELPPGLADLRPPVDYYGKLAAHYASARACLNVTGMLLPAGLTQRHFDVWAAGGLLLTDANPGLSIFPRELTEPVTFARAADIPALFERLTRDPALAHDLSATWRSLILREHTCARRAETICEVVCGKKSA